METEGDKKGYGNRDVVFLLKRERNEPYFEV
jgi:hypothetical protein